MTKRKAVILLFTVIINVAIWCSYCGNSGKYEVEYMPCTWKLGGIGIEVEGTNDFIQWICEYGFTDRYIYGRTLSKWFIIDIQAKKMQKYNNKKEFQADQMRYGIKVDSLVRAPMIEFPDLPYGHNLSSKEIQKYNQKKILPQMKTFEVYYDYLVGQTEASGDSAWLALDMKTDKMNYAPLLESLYFIPKYDKDEIEKNLKNIPDYWGYCIHNKLPAKEFSFFPCDIGDNVPCLIINGLYGCSVVVRFVEYYKKDKGYIFGKACRDYFIFNTRNEKCLYFRNEDEWLKKLKELKLSKTYMKYTSYTLLDKYEEEMSPWRE